MPNSNASRALVFLPFRGLHLRTDTAREIEALASKLNKPVAMVVRELLEAKVRELRRPA